jgi:hypothetical protein
MTLKWSAGVNYFSSHGDKRWWHDHRIPGGIALSINSVGHMVKSTILSHGMKELERELNIESQDWGKSAIDSLDHALYIAMKTIASASNGPSGKATWLLPLALRDKEHRPSCPTRLRSGLEDKDYCTYKGYYHTDITLPSEYFRPDLERPSVIQPHELDFTYLFDHEIENPDHTTMGTGRQIRADDVSQIELDRINKEDRMNPTSERIPDNPRLFKAITFNSGMADSDPD